MRGVDWTYLAQKPVAGFCEHGSEPSTWIKYGEFFDWLYLPLASQEWLSAMELVNVFTENYSPGVSENSVRWMEFDSV
jgi:hypothetical protein